MREEIITVDLTEIAQTGEAIGRFDGIVLFVPFGFPGDRAEVVVTERKRTFARGRIVRLLHADPQRTTPLCSHFTVCGGCEWQHILYAEQLRLKEQTVRTQLTRIGKLREPNVLACLPSPTSYGYRNHARLQRTPSGEIGYRAARSHAVVPVQQCPILEPELEQALQTLPLQDFPADQREIELCVSSPLQIGDYRYQIGPDSFFQVNTAVAAQLVAETLRALALQGQENVLELYCGMGLFTVPIAAQAGYVLGVEGNGAAIVDAQANIDQAGGAAQVAFITASVEQALYQPAVQQRRWDAIVLDPPRAGVDQSALLTVLALGARKLVYVSCDPATLARDVKLICEHGYQLLSAQPLDMFPQTHHVETVALLVRADL